ncbi:MAG: Holliday junction resolvase RuvX [Microgenomates group bacterium]
MNYLAIDYGTKNIGLAYSVLGIISTLDAIPNSPQTITKIQKIIIDYQISKIYVGLSEGVMAKKTLAFVVQLRSMLNLTIETVEEAVSTIEATSIYQQNKLPRKKYKKLVDSISAAVILNRVISSSSYD